MFLYGSATGSSRDSNQVSVSHSSLHHSGEVKGTTTHPQLCSLLGPSNTTLTPLALLHSSLIQGGNLRLLEVLTATQRNKELPWELRKKAYFDF